MEMYLFSQIEPRVIDLFGFGFKVTAEWEWITLTKLLIIQPFLWKPGCGAHIQTIESFWYL